MELTGSGKALVVTLLFRLLFGGYLLGLDLYNYNDAGSALTVLLIYGLIGIFATLFLAGKKYGLPGIIGLDVIFILVQSLFIFLALSQIVDPGLHGPIANRWATLLMYMFSLLTLTFAIKTYRESRPSLHILRSPTAS
jgi:ABC-type enterochelin transport system permease subunit